MIPIYRAKKIDSDEYVIGYYMPNYVIGDYESEDEDERQEWTEHFIMESFSQDLWVDDESYYNFEKVSEIDPTTLAIHFPDMIDSQGNKIFASLQEDGNGGDIVDFKHSGIDWKNPNGDLLNVNVKGVCVLSSYGMRVLQLSNFVYDRVFESEMGLKFSYDDLKIIGIQQ